LIQFHNTSDAGHAAITTGTIGNAVGSTQFFDSSSALNGVFTIQGATAGQSSAGSVLQFHNSSTAASGMFTISSAVSDLANGGEIDFYDTSTGSDPLIPGSATFVNMGAAHNGNGGLTQFFNHSQAVTASFTN
jgi:hypothetical protein